MAAERAQKAARRGGQGKQSSCAGWNGQELRRRGWRRPKISNGLMEICCDPRAVLAPWLGCWIRGGGGVGGRGGRSRAKTCTESAGAKKSTSAHEPPHCKLPTVGTLLASHHTITALRQSTLCVQCRVAEPPNITRQQFTRSRTRVAGGGLGICCISAARALLGSSCGESCPSSNSATGSSLESTGQSGRTR